MYTEDFKAQVVAEYCEGGTSYEALRRKYRIGGTTTIQKWVLKAKRAGQQMEDPGGMIEAQRQEIQQLRVELQEARIQAAYYETVIKISEEEYGIPFKKKLDGKLSLD